MENYFGLWKAQVQVQIVGNGRFRFGIRFLEKEVRIIWAEKVTLFKYTKTKSLFAIIFQVNLYFQKIFVSFIG